MNERQKLLLEMYKDIASVLESHGIRFYLVYGSAIGALRHKGFVPWDDDLDIAIMEEDQPLVDEVLYQELDCDRYFYQPARGDYHPHVLLKVPDMERNLRDKNVPFIDIFVISGYPSKPIRSSLYKMVTWCELLSSNALNRINRMFTYRLFGWSVMFFDRMRRRLIENSSTKTTIVDYYFKRCVFDRSDYSEPKMVPFEDTTAPVPKEYDMMLRSIYGDYMVPPPEDSRTGASGFPCSILQEYQLYEKTYVDSAKIK